MLDLAVNDAAAFTALADAAKTKNLVNNVYKTGANLSPIFLNKGEKYGFKNVTYLLAVENLEKSIALPRCFWI